MYLPWYLPYSIYFQTFSIFSKYFIIVSFVISPLGNQDNETTLRLLYYPPVIQEDDNKCEMTKGRCKYSQQRCNGIGGIDLVPPRDVKTEKSEKGSESDTEDDADETDDNTGNISDHSKSSRSSRSSSEKELNVTRCGAHCMFYSMQRIIFNILKNDKMKNKSNT